MEVGSLVGQPGNLQIGADHAGSSAHKEPGLTHLHDGCRQMLTRKWQQLVAQELQAGKERARLLETQAWLDQGLVLKVSPSLKAVNEQGHAVSLPVPVPINLNAIAG